MGNSNRDAKVWLLTAFGMGVLPALFTYCYFVFSAAPRYAELENGSLLVLSFSLGIYASVFKRGLEQGPVADVAVRLITLVFSFLVLLLYASVSTQTEKALLDNAPGTQQLFHAFISTTWGMRVVSVGMLILTTVLGFFCIVGSQNGIEGNSNDS